MKKLLFLFFGLLVLAGGCKKKEDAKPQTPAQVIAGQYTMTSVTSSGTTIPLPFSGNGTTASGTISVTQVAGQDAQVDISATIKISGQADATDAVKGVLVQAAASGYTLTYNNQPSGTADGTNIALKDGADGFTGKK